MTHTANVPCNGCTLCCQNDAVRLLPGDDPTKYQTEPHPIMPGQLMLAHKPNRECIYLGNSGCNIHSTRPQMCREMDCRAVVLMLKTRPPGFPEAAWNKGKQLLSEVTK